jgi:hypothetical protein
MRIIAFIASLVVAAQMIVTIIVGSSICPTQGCKIVEGLTIISPLLLNFLGLLFFQAVFWTRGLLKIKTFWGIAPLGVMLLCGLAFDSALLGYQIYVAQTFCAYCLVVFGFVLVLNLLNGRKQVIRGLAIMGVTLFSFSILSFVPGAPVSKTFSLKSAAYGLKSCSAPTKEIYLLFSSKCPHCQSIIKSMNQCNSCDLYLNPIDDIETLDIAGIELNEGFSPRINGHILTVLGIDTIPVLVSKGPDTYSIIKGEKNILNYIRHTCFTSDEVLYLDKSISTDDEEISVFSEESGECSVTVDCAESENLN